MRYVPCFSCHAPNINAIVDVNRPYLNRIDRLKYITRQLDEVALRQKYGDVQQVKADRYGCVPDASYSSLWSVEEPPKINSCIKSLLLALVLHNVSHYTTRFERSAPSPRALSEPKD